MASAIQQLNTIYDTCSEYFIHIHFVSHAEIRSTSYIWSPVGRKKRTPIEMDSSRPPNPRPQLLQILSRPVRDEHMARFVGEDQTLDFVASRFDDHLGRDTACLSRMLVELLSDRDRKR